MDPLSSFEIYSAEFCYFDVSPLCFDTFFSLSTSHILSNTDTLQLKSILKSQFPPLLSLSSLHLVLCLQSQWQLKY